MIKVLRILIPLVYLYLLPYYLVTSFHGGDLSPVNLPWYTFAIASPFVATLTLIPLFPGLQNAWKRCFWSWGGGAIGFVLTIGAATIYDHYDTGRESWGAVLVMAIGVFTLVPGCGILGVILYRFRHRKEVCGNPNHRRLLFIELCSIASLALFLFGFSQLSAKLSKDLSDAKKRMSAAVERNDLDEVGRILDAHSSLLTPRYFDHETMRSFRRYDDPVNVAAKSGNPELVRLFHERGAEPTKGLYVSERIIAILYRSLRF